jgi:Mrp family chromosome partitioning ATPase
MECHDLKLFTSLAKEHAVNPRNYGPLAKFDGHARITGPCGDTMEFWVAEREGKVERVAFVTDGCGSSRACGSMATSLAEGQRIEAAASLRQADILEALGDHFPEEHCALLAANTLKAACANADQHRDETTINRAPCATCTRQCAASTRNTGESDRAFSDRQKLQSRLCRIRRKIVVLSGKGGVGKSTVAVNLAMALVLTGKKVGLLDVDVHGPSIPTMLGLEDKKIEGCKDGILPISLGGLKVMSVGFLLKSQDDAVIWRGPMKMNVIRQFLQDVDWGDLDCLIVDSPPGTGDEPLSVCKLIGNLDGAVIVTTPQKVATVDVRKSITFCRKMQVPILGVVENMNGFACPRCGEITRILSAGGGKRIAEDMSVPFLGSIPMDPMIAEACDSGQVFVQSYAASPTAEIMQAIIAPIARLLEAEASHDR